jgi:starch phosphorylase
MGMDNQSGVRDPSYGFLHTDIEGVDYLADLALDLAWTWNHGADDIWKEIDPAQWELTSNPWVVLQSASRDRLKSLLADAAFKAKIDAFRQRSQAEAAASTWFQQTHPNSSLTSVAYFSMEYMLSEALPIYVGGLGNVAGDQLKAASDLGVPVVGVGLLYQEGYFRQEIDQNGWQQAMFPYNDPGQLPVTPLRLPNGEWLRFELELSGWPVWVRAWQVRVGRVKLYLLDTNDLANLPFHRAITSEVYGGGQEMRIKQEIVLGIGGWRLLKALGLKPEVCHLNEGHAAFLVLERAHDLMTETGLPFFEALAVTRAGNHFTTHTAVAAGFDLFSPALMWQYFGAFAEKKFGISFDDLMALGRSDRYNTSQSFNMAYLAIHGCGAVNGVSQLHGRVSRHLFESLYPRWPIPEVPVGAVTNGIHTPSWDSGISDQFWEKACGKDRWRGDQGNVGDQINKLADEEFWDMRNRSRSRFIEYARKKMERQLTVFGFPPALIEQMPQAFDPKALTLGFARRFVEYKRVTLLLHDPDRLIRILTNSQQPVQLLIAGKAPPFDDSGKALIQQWVQFIRQHELFSKVAFLNDYDMLLAEHMVNGVDVWINTPRRPWEACGTSGMKVLANGGLNLSELDGWWVEAYKPEVGWALGDGQEHGDDPAWDAREAEALYELLEQQVIPEFYHRNATGIPTGWVKKMRASMSTLTAAYSANRAVREYTEHYYLPAAARYLQRVADKGTAGSRIMGVQRELNDNWGRIKFGQLHTEQKPKGWEFQIPVTLGAINKDSIRVELFADATEGHEMERIPMQSVAATDGGKAFLFSAEVETTRAATDYTPRIMPAYEGIAVPLEDAHILWQH